MKLVPVTLMYLGSFAFLGANSAPLDVASEFRKKWSQWALSRARRDLWEVSSSPTRFPDLKAGPSFNQPQQLRATFVNLQVRENAVRSRLKRYQPRSNLQRPRSIGCRFGTCTMQNLAHRLYHYTDKDKDFSAPPKKISPQGYGRRRRRSLPVAGEAGTQLSAESLVRQGSTSRAH